MSTFVTLYHGNTIGSAKLVAVTADPELVKYVAEWMLKHEAGPRDTIDPVLKELARGRNAALRIIRDTEEH